VFVLGIMLHEIMSRGVHPMGERSHDWHHQIKPGFNRWQKNDFWRRWVDKDCPIAQPLPDHDLADLVAACLAPSTAARPSLHEVQAALLGLIHQRSATAAKQVNLFLGVAESLSAAEEWQHLKDCVEGVERAIKARYPRNAA
jgi:hypothetical protein